MASINIAYLCETNLYVDTGGTLADISPTPPLAAPGGLVGGYGDDLYDQGVQLTATAPFTTSSPNITMSPNIAGVVPGMDVFNVTTNNDVGVVSTFSGTALVLTANAASATSAARPIF